MIDNTQQNNKWVLLAQDFNSPFFRNFIWVSSMHKFPELLGVPAPLIGIFSHKNAIHYNGDISTWEATHRALVQKTEHDMYFVDSIIDRTNAWGDSFTKWSETEIFNADVKNFTDERIVELLREFMERQSTLYTLGVTMPILDFQNFSFVEDNLKKILKRKTTSEAAYLRLYEIFTTPQHSSFAEEQEIALLELVRDFDSSTWKADVVAMPLAQLAHAYPEFYSRLKAHTTRFAWVYYVYSGPAFTEQQFLEFIQDYVHRGIEPAKRLAEIAHRKTRYAVEFQQEYERLRPSEFEAMILKLAGKLVWAKPRRKDYQSKAYYHVEKLQRELAHRLTVSLNQVRSMPLDLIKRTLVGKEPLDIDAVNSIYDAHFCVPREGGIVQVLWGEEAKKLAATNVVLESAHAASSSVNEIHGTPAFKGRATGTVRVINTSAEMAKMNYGDILVSVATTPAIVPAMKKAAAIVSDEGGLTCHAAIVSRELEIPCVTGTKFATSVFKDGDMVEVDASSGRITKLQ